VRWVQALTTRRWSACANGLQRHGGQRDPGDVADTIFTKMLAFANFASREPLDQLRLARLLQRVVQLYHPGCVCAALLNSQPMGFYSPQSLVDDRRTPG